MNNSANNLNKFKNNERERESWAVFAAQTQRAILPKI
ncbi:MAG: hypothetical protein MRECE_34c011 [Mycoplasmataceae bacterium CE_OT135]|nr:MAG: hypothetical protein MRECE_34c011 [Mycoplasmataceae bacterium CE_OT135]